MSLDKQFNETDFYHQSVMGLCQSLILKSHVTAIAMNEMVDKYNQQRRFPPVDKYHQETWRYYRHLNGEYHSYDIDMLNQQYYKQQQINKMNSGCLWVLSLDTAEDIPFTKEMLSQHRATWRHYSQKGEFYQKLIKQYPDLHVLIDGICNPIPYEKSIPAKEYEILYYDRRFVEEQEIYLIEQLQRHIDGMCLSYHSKGYMQADELYRGMKLAILACHLPGMIISIREKYARTDYAHSYHIWQYLSSWYRLDDFKQVLSPMQTRWLYRHIRYIDINAGKQATFNLLMHWLLSIRNIPLYEFNISSEPSTLVETLKHNPVVDRVKLNLLQFNENSEQEHYTIGDLHDKEKRIHNNNPDFRDPLNTEANYNFFRGFTRNKKTKMLESEVFDYSGRDPFPLPYIALNHWVYYAFTDRYLTRNTVRHPKTGEGISLDPKEGFILWWYGMTKLANVWDDRLQIENQLIPTIKVFDILFHHTTINWNNLKRKEIYQKYKIDESIDSLREFYPLTNTFYSTEVFLDFAKTVRSFRHFQRLLEAMHQDLGYHGEMEYANKRTRFNTRFQLTDNPMTFGQFMQSKSFVFDELSQEEMLRFTTDLWIAFTGLSNDDQSSLQKTQELLLALYKRLSSYTIQFTGETIGSSALVLGLPFVRTGVETSKEEAIVRMKRGLLPAIRLLHRHEVTIRPLPIIAGDSNITVSSHDKSEYDYQPAPLITATSRTIRKHCSRLGLVGARVLTPLEIPQNIDHYYTFRQGLYYWRDDLPDKEVHQAKQGKRVIIQPGYSSSYFYYHEKDYQRKHGVTTL